MSHPEIARFLLWALAGSAILFLIQARLARFLQPMRLELAREGEELLKDGRLPKQYRDLITFELDNAYNPCVSIFATGVAPIVAFLHLTGLRQYRPPHISDPDLRLRYERVDSMFTRSIVLANLPAGVLFIAEIALLRVFVALVGGSWAAVETIKAEALHADGRPLAGLISHSH